MPNARYDSISDYKFLELDVLEQVAYLKSIAE